ncbi:MAG: hypothetical protein AB2A00_06540 [Myxococcota bacterium]
MGVNGNVVDLYFVESEDGTIKREVFMDMYFENYEERLAVDGFFMTGRLDG